MSPPHSIGSTVKCTVPKGYQAESGTLQTAGNVNYDIEGATILDQSIQVFCSCQFRCVFDLKLPPHCEGFAERQGSSGAGGGGMDRAVDFVSDLVDCGRHAPASRSLQLVVVVHHADVDLFVINDVVWLACYGSGNTNTPLNRWVLVLLYNFLLCCADSPTANNKLFKHR
jgi:hypothetical protein